MRSMNFYKTILLCAHRRCSTLGDSSPSKGLPRKLPLAGVKKIVLVASGKGGVGKSTVSANLACALKVLNPKLQIGLLDADVYGPSVPRMMNIGGQPEVNDQGLMIPLENHSIKCMSMGFLVGDSAAIVWRGLMVMSAIGQLTRKVRWGPLDYLVVDMPPGTGDAQLSICQTVPIDGVVLVTTPQDIAVLDARRGAEMFRKVDARILGIVENMGSYVCGACGNRESIFGEGGAQTLADEIGELVIGEIPLSARIRKAADAGVPIVMDDPEGPVTQAYKSIAQTVIEKLPIS